MTSRNRVAKLTLALAVVASISACERGPEQPVAQHRISLDQATRMPAEPQPSPETDDARWTVAGNGQAVDFGRPGETPMLTLACDLRKTPAELRIVRHVTARPGQKALFPVIGNGTISRFMADATLAEGEWRWQAALPATDPMLDVFTGPREIEATLPGGGSLMIEGSRIPGEFVTWCRAGGQAPWAEAAEEAEDAETAARPSSAPPAR